jgi:hypothetical protein
LDFVDTGPLSRSSFSVEYGLDDNRIVKARRLVACLVVLFNARAGRSSFEVCMFKDVGHFKFQHEGLQQQQRDAWNRQVYTRARRP